MNKKIEEILSTTKLNELLKREEKKECNKKVLWGILAAVGAIVVVAGIAYAVYYFFFARKALEEFEDEYIYDDDFDIIDGEDEDIPVVDISEEDVKIFDALNSEEEGFVVLTDEEDEEL